MSPSMWAWRVVLPGLGLVACSLVLWQSSRAEGPRPESSTPARAPGEPGRVVAEGRIAARPGAEVTLGTEAGGTVLALVAAERSKVKKGELLVELRSDDLRFALAEAEARLAEAAADLAFHQAEYERKSKASTPAAQFQADVQGGRRDLEVSRARSKGAEVAVARARALLARAKVASPIDGTVIATFVEPGELAPAGSRLATVCDLDRLRIEAEVDEFDVARIAEGDEVAIKAEGYAASWRGKVEEVPDRVAPRTVRPDDPGRPSDTRVLLVKIGLVDAVPLKLGQKVEVEIRPRHRADLGVPGKPPVESATSEGR